MQQVQYDPQIIGTHAGQLYARADRIVAEYMVRGVLIGILLGLVAGGGLGEAMARAALGGAFVGAVVCAAIGAAFGWQAGQAAAFHLRLEAQRVLVLMQIEFNTRPRR